MNVLPLLTKHQADPVREPIELLHVLGSRQRQKNFAVLADVREHELREFNQYRDGGRF
jgi:hypothetical protein